MDIQSGGRKGWRRGAVDREDQSLFILVLWLGSKWIDLRRVRQGSECPWRLLWVKSKQGAAGLMFCLIIGPLTGMNSWSTWQKSTMNHWRWWWEGGKGCPRGTERQQGLMQITASGLAREPSSNSLKRSLAREASQTQPLLPPLIQLSQNVTALCICWGFQALSAPASPGQAASRLQTSVTRGLRGHTRLWKIVGNVLLPCELLALWLVQEVNKGGQRWQHPGKECSPILPKWTAHNVKLTQGFLEGKHVGTQQVAQRDSSSPTLLQSSGAQEKRGRSVLWPGRNIQAGCGECQPGN